MLNKKKSINIDKINTYNEIDILIMIYLHKN